MDPVNLFLGILIVGALIYWIGHSFIDSYFKQKGELLTSMYEKGVD